MIDDEEQKKWKPKKKIRWILLEFLIRIFLILIYPIFIILLLIVNDDDWEVFKDCALIPFTSWEKPQEEM